MKYLAVLSLILGTFAPLFCADVDVELGAEPNAALSPKAAAEAQTLSLNAAALRAWNQSRQVLIAQAQLLGTQAQARSATAFLRPQLSASANYIREDEGDPSLGQSTLEDIYTTRVELNQFLYGFGRRQAANDVALYLELAASADYDRIRNEAATLARRAYISIWLSQANIVINESRVKQRQDEVNDSRALEAAGSISPLDVRLAEINLASNTNTLLQAQANEQIALFELARLLSLPITSGVRPLEVSGDLNVDTHINDLLELAKTQLYASSDLKQIAAQKNIQSAHKELIASNYYPQISAQAQYNGIGETFEDSEYQWQIGVGLKWTLIDGGARNADTANIHAQSEILEQQYLALMESKQQSFAAIEVDALTLLARIEQQAQIISLAEQNYADTRLLYQAGGTTITRLGDSSLALQEARFLRAHLQYQLHNIAVSVQQLIEQAPIAP